MTHGLSFLPQADLILVMEDGEITEMGSYAKLLSRKNAFADFVEAFSVSERKESATHRGKIKECLMSYYNKTFLCWQLKMQIHLVLGTRKSVSRLSMTDFSIDLSQEQLIRYSKSHSVLIMKMQMLLRNTFVPFCQFCLIKRRHGKCQYTNHGGHIWHRTGAGAGGSWKTHPGWQSSYRPSTY